MSILRVKRTTAYFGKLPMKYLLWVVCLFSPLTLAEDALNFSGFARIVGGYLDTDKATFKGYDEDFSLTPSSLIGLQLDYQALDTLSITGQVVGRADNDKDSEVEWLYLNWKPLDNFTVKTGRLRTPFFSLSDYTDVGYAYHWVLPPVQVYSAFLDRQYDGIDLIWNRNFDLFDLSFEIYAGDVDGEANVGSNFVPYTANNLLGAIGKISNGNLQFRLSYYKGKAVFDLPELDAFALALQTAGFQATADSLNTEMGGDVRQAGLIYDNLKFFLHSELVDIKVDSGVGPDMRSYYYSGGYSFNPVTLHLTYAKSHATAKPPVNEIPIGLDPGLDVLAFTYQGILQSFGLDNMKSWTVGARWDVTKNVALKFDWERIEGKPGQTGFYVIEDQSFDRKSNLFLMGAEIIF